MSETVITLRVASIEHSAVCSGCGAQAERGSNQQQIWDAPRWYRRDGSVVRGFRCQDCQRTQKLSRRAPGLLRRLLYGRMH